MSCDTLPTLLTETVAAHRTSECLPHGAPTQRRNRAVVRPRSNRRSSVAESVRRSIVCSSRALLRKKDVVLSTRHSSFVIVIHLRLDACLCAISYRRRDLL